MNKVIWMVSIMILSTSLVAGCGTATGNHLVSPKSPNNAAGGGDGSKPATKTPSTAQSPGGTVTGSNATMPAARALVNQSMTLAKQGKAIDIPFAVQRNISVVQNAWGNPNSQNAAGAGVYWTYSSHGAAFGLNKGDQIMDVRSYSSKLKAITPADVTSVLGQSGDMRQTSDSVIYMYPAGVDYQLLFVFPRTSTGISKAVDHVSVFWPQGTVNSMAATQPAPSVVIRKAPGSMGSLFTFTIQNPPSGYRLVELEWLSSQGMSVVNTYLQAFTGGAIPGFSISVDGKMNSFIYPSSMRGQTGTVRVIYQTTSGAAMIGNSSSVMLK